MISDYILNGLAKERQAAFLAEAEATRLARRARRAGRKTTGARWSPRLWVPRLGREARRVMPARPAA
jgi:hypothetical protein